MNKGFNFIKELKSELEAKDVKNLVRAGLLEAYKQLKEMIGEEQIYSIGIYSGNMGFTYIVFTANTYEGLNSKVKEYLNSDSEYNEEQQKYSLKWNSADWKYHDCIESISLGKASDVLTELTDKMYNLGECEEPEPELTDEQFEEVFSNGKPIIEVVPDYNYYDLYNDVYDPGHEIIYKTLNQAINEFREEAKVSDEVICGLFCGDASYDFMLENNISTNNVQGVSKIVKDIKHLSSLFDVNFLDKEYSDFEK